MMAMVIYDFSFMNRILTFRNYRDELQQMNKHEWQIYLPRWMDKLGGT